ncbi:MAG: hypothetical protein IPL96_01825 [Holophagaceae bacterium]|nr:hypothetical protein [Holophagaceae bacterium]
MTPAAAPPFCARCTAGSTAPGAPSVSTNQGIGSMFWGRAATCDECGSSIRTLWRVFLLLPVFPRGSFRVIQFEEEVDDGESRTAFVSRRIPLRWPQVAKGCGASLAALCFLLWLIANRAR